MSAAPKSSARLAQRNADAWDGHRRRGIEAENGRAERDAHLCDASADRAATDDADRAAA